MNRRAARTVPTYLPRLDLRERHPGWKIRPAPAGTMGDGWVSFNPHLKIIVLNCEPDIDRDFAVAFAVALLDSGHIRVGMPGISDELARDAEDLADLRLGVSLSWETPAEI